MIVKNDIIISIVGVLGTIVGTILGWMLNIVSKRGKLNIYISSWKEFIDYDKTLTCENKEYVTNCSYICNLELYNSSCDNKIVRNIEIVFNDGAKDILCHKPIVQNNKEYGENSSIRHSIEVANIPPKTVTCLALNDWFKNENEEIKLLWSVKKIFLKYTNEKNVTKRLLISNKDYYNYFTNIQKTNNI